MTDADGEPGALARVCTGPTTLLLSWGCRSHPGKLRGVNEDAFLAEPPVFVVADGMGGHAGGEVASSLTVDALVDLTRATLVTAGDVRDVVTRANAAIAALAAAGDRVMGTTLTGLVAGRSATGDEVLVVNVGDSRTYRWRDGSLEQLTVDHSHVQELVDAGLLDPADAARHPERNVVTRALGVDDDLAIDLMSVQVRAGDRFLICSDGLTSELGDPAIAGELAAADPEDVAEALVDRVLGGRAADNITVVILDVVAIEPADGDVDRTDPRSNRAADRTDPRPRVAPAGWASTASVPVALIDDVPMSEQPPDEGPETTDVSPVVDLIDAVPSTLPGAVERAEEAAPDV